MTGNFGDLCNGNAIFCIKEPRAIWSQASATAKRVKLQKGLICGWLLSMFPTIRKIGSQYGEG